MKRGRGEKGKRRWGDEETKIRRDESKKRRRN